MTVPPVILDIDDIDAYLATVDIIYKTFDPHALKSIFPPLFILNKPGLNLYEIRAITPPSSYDFVFQGERLSHVFRFTCTKLQQSQIISDISFLTSAIFKYLKNEDVQEAFAVMRAMVGAGEKDLQARGFVDSFINNMYTIYILLKNIQLRTGLSLEEVAQIPNLVQVIAAMRTSTNAWLGVLDWPADSYDPQTKELTAAFLEFISEVNSALEQRGSKGRKCPHIPVMQLWLRIFSEKFLPAMTSSHF